MSAGSEISPRLSRTLLDPAKLADPIIEAQDTCNGASLGTRAIPTPYSVRGRFGVSGVAAAGLVFFAGGFVYVLAEVMHTSSSHKLHLTTCTNSTCRVCEVTTLLFLHIPTNICRFTDRLTAATITLRSQMLI